MAQEFSPPFTLFSDFSALAKSERELLSPSLEPQTKSRNAVTIKRDIDKVFAFVSNVDHLSDLLLTAELRAAPGKENWGLDLSVEREAGQIRFASTRQSLVSVRGTVSFAEASGHRGTVITVESDYDLPGGKVQEWLKTFSGHDPHSVIQIQLKRLKAFMETGEIPTTQGQPSGRSNETSSTVH